MRRPISPRDSWCASRVGFPSSPSRLHRRRPHGSSRRTAMVPMELEILGMNFGCVLAALADAKIPEKDCILPLASKLLGYAIVAASTTVKLPQVPPLSLSPASRRALFVSNGLFCLDLWRTLPVEGCEGGSQFHVLCVSMAWRGISCVFWSVVCPWRGAAKEERNRGGSRWNSLFLCGMVADWRDPLWCLGVQRQRELLQ
jgi:hypothetical protein